MNIEKLKILYVCDPNLGERGQEVLSRYCLGDNVTSFFFDKKVDNPRTVRKQILQAAKEEGGFDILISFYSDLVLKNPQLQCVRVLENGGRLATNIHPGSNLFPGLGYDTLPLIRGEKEHGPVWHFMNDESVDAGPVIRILLKNIEGMKYLKHRHQNQNLCLELLRQQMEDLDSCSSCEEVFDRWNKSVHEQGLKWDDTYVNNENLGNILARFYQEFSDHGVFDGLPYLEEIRALARRAPSELENRVVIKLLDGVIPIAA